MLHLFKKLLSVRDNPIGQFTDNPICRVYERILSKISRYMVLLIFVTFYKQDDIILLHYTFLLGTKKVSS